jgi:hypothetical protein
MVRDLMRLTGLGLLVMCGAAGLYVYQQRYSTVRQIEKLQQQTQEYKQIVERLSSERRVADLLALDQHRTPDGRQQTTVLFVEYARDGSTLPPRSFVIEGEMAHLDAKVVKFETNLVKESDPLRGHSIALFTRIYGDLEAPERGHQIDQPGQIPLVYRGADPRISRFEQDLWKTFWRLADDPGMRQQAGVRVAQGEGLWWPIEAEKLYTVTIESDGGLNLTWEPLRGIYREALKETARTAPPATGPTSTSAGVAPAP